LKKSILRMREAGCEREILPSARFDRWRAVTVAFDGDRSTQCSESKLPIEFRQARTQRNPHDCGNHEHKHECACDKPPDQALHGGTLQGRARGKRNMID
jgi:hypothetical protein